MSDEHKPDRAEEVARKCWDYLWGTNGGMTCIDFIAAALRSYASEETQRAERAEAERLEQARLLGMSGERECALRAELARLAADKARLDWLCASWTNRTSAVPRHANPAHQDYRAAIDAAMQEGKP